jgi:hypothetical protein
MARKPKKYVGAPGSRTIAKIAHRVESDPALAAFLALIDKDLTAGRNIGDLPLRVAAALRRAEKRVRVELEQELAGELSL